MSPTPLNLEEVHNINPLELNTDGDEQDAPFSTSKAARAGARDSKEDLNESTHLTRIQS